MQDNYPKISIITPSFNQGNFLEDTILSVLDQNYPNLEYIIIDGGSADNSVDIIKKYENHLAYWISEPDKGQSDAINKGFHKSTGVILHWLNSDDQLIPGSLKEVSEYFNTNKDIDCVIGDLEVVGPNNEYLAIKKSIPFHFTTALYSACLVPQPATLFTRRAWEKTGDVDVSLAYQMDFEYFMRMANAGIKFGLIKKPLARFRLHTLSKTVSGYDDKVLHHNDIIQRKFLPAIINNAKFRKIYLKLLKKIFKGRIYLARIFLRGDFIPFKAQRARKSIQ